MSEKLELTCPVCGNAFMGRDISEMCDECKAKMTEVPVVGDDEDIPDSVNDELALEVRNGDA